VRRHDDDGRLDTTKPVMFSPKIFRVLSTILKLNLYGDQALSSEAK